MEMSRKIGEDICGEVTHLTKDCKYGDKHTGKPKEVVVINDTIMEMELILKMNYVHF